MKRTHIALLAAVAALGLSISPLAAHAAQDKTVDHSAHAAAAVETTKAEDAKQGMMMKMDKQCPSCEKKMEGHDMSKMGDMEKMAKMEGKNTKAHDMSKMGETTKSE